MLVLVALGFPLFEHSLRANKQDVNGIHNLAKGADSTAWKLNVTATSTGRQC